MRRQRPVKGGRKRLGTCALREIEQEVKHTAHKFNVSVSFVVAVLLAKALHIKIEDYY